MTLPTRRANADGRPHHCGLLHSMERRASCHPRFPRCLVEWVAFVRVTASLDGRHSDVAAASGRMTPPAPLVGRPLSVRPVCARPHCRATAQMLRPVVSKAAADDDGWRSCRRHSNIVMRGSSSSGVERRARRPFAAAIRLADRSTGASQRSTLGCNDDRSRVQQQSPPSATLRHPLLTAAAHLEAE